ncbi:MAG: Fic family protein [Bacteroidales bacterium]|nr:Fic family protein [Bacteroidales bacterium]
MSGIAPHINALQAVLQKYRSLGISEQIDYDKFYLYSIITHSTAIEGSTVTEVENMLLFDEGISAKGRPMVEQLMNLDLKHAYEQSILWAKEHKPFSVDMLKNLAAMVMRNTGSVYSTLMGSFDSSKGDLRLVGVTAGAGGRSYMNYLKIPAHLDNFCKEINCRREALRLKPDEMEAYMLSFDAHNILVGIHPWVDGNGRMSRLIMNHLQVEFGLIPTKVLTEDKAAYIEALNASREEESMQPFRIFMLQEHTKILADEIARYEKTMVDDTKDDTKQPSDRQRIILQMITGNDTITINEMIQKTGVSAVTIKRDLAALQAMGLLRREGGRKKGRWVTA